MIVTLAGHVDHGKTSLVRALTGVNTDRLAEEQARGLTIDLGFAYAEDAGLGFVDVPGHHRFIHNMVAGVAAPQYALLVIAADDGPMPQTIEHLNILTLLGVAQGCIALTKVDLVDEARRAAARAEIQEAVADSFLAGARLFEVAAVSQPSSVEPLREHLQQQAADHTQQTSNAEFRLAVDRAFNVKGSGTVVTGTVLSGSIRADDAISVFPSGASGRVRSIRTSNQAAKRAAIGQRTALNLAGIALEDVARGTWIATNARQTNEASARLTVLNDFPRPLKHWTPVHLYHGTSHTTGRVALLDSDRLQPGESGLVDLVCDEPLLLRAGDRILVRDQSLDTTLGGATVCRPQPPKGRRRAPERIARSKAYEQAEAAMALSALIELEPVHIADFAAHWGVDPSDLHPPAGTSEREGWLVRDAQWEGWSSEIVAFVGQALQRNTNVQGIRENELPAGISSQFRSQLLRELVASKALAQTGGMFHLPRHEASLSAPQQQLLEQVTPALDHLQPPSVGDLAKQTNKPLHQLTRSLQELAKLKVIDRVGDNRYFLPPRLDEIAQRVREIGAEGPFTVRQFRDATGIGRNVAIDILEHFDGRGFTRRQGDARIVAGAWRDAG